VFKACVTSTSCFRTNRRRNPWRWGHFLRLPGTLGNPLQGSGIPSPAAAAPLRRLRAADPELGAVVSVGQRCGDVSAELTRRSSRSGTRWPTGERERHVPASTAAAVMWNSNLVLRSGTIFGLQTNGRTDSNPDVAAASVRWEYGYTPEPGSRGGLAHRSVHLPPGLGLQGRNTEGSLGQPHQACWAEPCPERACCSSPPLPIASHPAGQSRRG